MKKKIMVLASILMLLACGCAKKNAAMQPGSVVPLKHNIWGPEYVYPNPITPPEQGRVVFFAENPCDVRITIFNLMGENLWQTTVSNAFGKGDVYLNTGKLKAGVYICRISYIKSGKEIKKAFCKFAKKIF